MASRTDALKVVAAVGLASLVKGEEANNRDVADNFGRDRRLYQDESWYNLPDPAMNGQQPPPMMYEEPPMHNVYVETPPMHYNPPMENLPMHQNPPMHGGASWWQGSDAMPEAKGGKEHGSEMVSNGWWEPAWQEAAKASKTHNEGAASGWWQAAPEKVHAPEASGWWEAGSAKSEKVHHPEPSWGWWEAGSAKAEKSGKSKSAKHSSGWWSGSMPTTTHATTPATTTTTTAGWSTIPAAKGDKPHDSWETTTTTSTWWAAPSWTDGAKSHKSAKSKTAKSAKSAKTAGWEAGSEWDSTWTPPTPCGKAEDCPEQTVPVPPSGEHMEANAESASSPSSSPLVPITMAPVAGMGTDAPTTLIDGLTREAGWFQSGKDYETAELQYKRERVEGLAKQMEWKNSSSRPHVFSYLAVVAAAGVYYILC